MPPAYLKWPPVLSRLPYRLVIVSCEGKIDYPSSALAKAAIERSRKMKNRHSYHCEFCHRWHLGTNAIRTSKRRGWLETEGDSDE